MKLNFYNKLGFIDSAVQSVLSLSVLDCKGGSSNNLSFKQEWLNLESLLEIIKSDKKSTGKLTMVLIDNKPFLEDIEDISILIKVLKQIYEVI